MKRKLIIEINKMRKMMGLCEDFTAKTLDVNNNEYDLYFDYYGNNPKSLMWMTKGSQNSNFKMVSKYIKDGDSLLDYGCGIGDFIKYLNDNDVKVSKYLGVDINQNFIDAAKKDNPDYSFKFIDSIDDLKGKWDVVCAIGVFTWFITKKEFIEIVNKLYNISSKQLILTLLKGKTPYDVDEYDKKDEDEYWNKEYRFYSEKLFTKLFPDLKFSYEYDKLTMLVKIEKS